MTVVIDGTNGVSGVDGTASNPALEGTDSNTGIFFPAADTIAFAEGGAEVARFDSAGNFGIGTSSPAAKLDVNGVEIALKVVANNGGIKLVSSENSTNTGYAAFFNGTSRVGYIGYADTTYGLTLATDAGSSMPLRFVVNGTEEARIDSSGNLLVGTTTVAGSNLFTTSAPASGTGGIAVRTNSTNNPSFELYNSSNARKSLIYLDVANVRTYVVTNDVNGVYLGSNATSWTSASDERIKDIIEPIENAVQKLESWRTVIGKYKSDEEGKRRSFLIAQDVLATFPEAVDTDNQDEYGLSYQDIIPVLVKSIQELKAELDATKAKVAALEGAA